MLHDLAGLLGIQSSYSDFYGNVHEVPDSTLRALMQSMGHRVRDEAAAERLTRRLEKRAALDSVYLVSAVTPQPIMYRSRRTARWTLTLESGGSQTGKGNEIRFEGPLELGYHRLDVGGKTATLIAVPASAYLSETLVARKLWGIAAQLYSLRSARNWGIGDFSDLATLLRATEQLGGATVSVNPLHELTLENPTSASPYSPTSRLHLNGLYVDVDAAARALGKSDALRTAVDASTLEQIRQSTLVDYAAVADLKLRALRALHDTWKASPEFERFRDAAGPALEHLAIYEALMHEMRRSNPGVYGWVQWPKQFADPRSPAVREFARAHSRDVEFFAFVQWLADEQLGAASSSANLPLGLYRDLAVGVDANSAEVWSDREAYCLGASVGAPADPMNPLGQNWGFTPLDPQVLRARAYAPFVTLLRANMRHARVLRIDHVMGLMRLFCTPSGATAADGTYINYRFDEMLGVLALESHRNRCMIVGEDLGTVPAGFRERLAAANIFGCRLLYFERGSDGRFREPHEYDVNAVASTGTHDVAPFAGFWSGADLRDRAQLGFYANDFDVAAAHQERETARNLLLHVLGRNQFIGVVEAGMLESAQEAASDELLVTLVRAAYTLLGRSEARLLLVQLEDLALQRNSVNTPGTFDEMPNWRHRLGITVDALTRDQAVLTMAEAVSAARQV
jgi:(1->4)-alpha-D-glucan 1-alpha-D-glucosylmutase